MVVDDRPLVSWEGGSMHHMKEVAEKCAGVAVRAGWSGCIATSIAILTGRICDRATGNPPLRWLSDGSSCAVKCDTGEMYRTGIMQMWRGR